MEVPSLPLSLCRKRRRTGTGATVLHSYACIGALNLYELAMSVPSLQVCFAPDCRDQFGPRSSYAATLCSWDAQDRLVGELAAKKIFSQLQPVIQFVAKAVVESK